VPVVAIPDPATERPPDLVEAGPPAADGALLSTSICLVTGEPGARLQPVPIAVWSASDPVMLPVTDAGLAQVVDRIRGAQAIVVGAAVATMASLGGLDLLLPWVGNGRYLSLVIFVVGVLIARTRRQATLYGISNRNGVRVLFVPDPRGAGALRDAVRRAPLSDDYRRQLESAERLAALNEHNHPLAD
jgi:hypothetical protein